MDVTLADLDLLMGHSYKPVEMSHSGLKNEVSRITLDLSQKLCLLGCRAEGSYELVCCFPLVYVISCGN